MGNYSFRNSDSVAAGVFTILVLGYLTGIRFDNVYLDKIIWLLLSLSPLIILVIVLQRSFKRKITKIVLSLLLGTLTVISFPFILLSTLDLYFTNQNSGPQFGFKKVEILNLQTSRVVVYRTNGGAMTSFGITVRYEKPILPGIYIKRDLLEIYGAEDVNLSVVSPNSIRINSIEFSDPQYRAEYLNENPKVRVGQTIKVN